MNDDTTAKSSVSGTTCRIGPPADERFDEEAFLLREMAEAKAALRRTVGAVKEHAGHELTPKRLLKRHPLAVAGAAGVGGLLLVRRVLRMTTGRRTPRAEAAPAQAAPKAGLPAMLVPSVIAIVQSLAAAKSTNAAAAATNPQAWMAQTLWGLARDRFGKHQAPAPADPQRPANPQTPADSQTAADIDRPADSQTAADIDRPAAVRPHDLKSDGPKAADSRSPAKEPIRRRRARPR